MNAEVLRAALAMARAASNTDPNGMLMVWNQLSVEERQAVLFALSDMASRTVTACGGWATWASSVDAL